MAISEDQIKEALRTVKYPGFSRDIVSFGLVKGIEARNGNVTVRRTVRGRAPDARAARSVTGSARVLSPTAVTR